ncbi:MAG: hypothetical protein MR964_04135 [Campylobacter sp.]|uniref:hypothetical protein n=1 Tax=Campylobacter sp. TaxID=205 RepID=UPI002AA7A04A|nr:hypothetical protein [Campylobacter sp.]MCI7014043.1 hypothetical protein [Campylobacter sp.]MCI7023401.1 hypothetical protein [Campylobacter sp.]
MWQWLANFALSQSFLALSQRKAQVLLNFIYAVCALISFIFVMIRESKKLIEL